MQGGTKIDKCKRKDKNGVKKGFLDCGKKGMG